VKTASGKERFDALPSAASGRSARAAADSGRSNPVQKPSPTTHSAEEPIKVAIVDDDYGARWFLQRILEKSGEFRCFGCYASGEEAFQEIPVAPPKIVLMDIRMPGISGIECTRRLKGTLPGLIVVFVSGVGDLQTMLEALKAGSDGYLTKPFAIAQCLAMLRFAAGRNSSTVPDGIAVDELSAVGRNESTRLTDREREVMQRLARGSLYKEIADQLGISYSAVHKHQQNIFAKLHVTNRTEAVVKWYGLSPA